MTDDLKHGAAADNPALPLPGQVSRFTTARAPVTVSGVDFETLYRTYRSALVRIVKCADATEEEANDAVQVAFAQLLRATYPIAEPKAWLVQVALNEFRGHTPRIATSRRSTTEIPIAPHAVPEPAGAYAPSAAEVAAHNEEHRQALAEIATLPGKQRVVLHAHYFGLTHGQIAEHFGMTADAVRQNFSRACKTLRKQRAMTSEDAS